MSLIPHSLILSGLVFLLAGLLRILDRKKTPSSMEVRTRSARRKMHGGWILVGFILIWVGVFLLIRGYR